MCVCQPVVCLALLCRLLFQSYKSSAYLWECVAMLRRAALIVINVALFESQHWRGGAFVVLHVCECRAVWRLGLGLLAAVGRTLFPFVSVFDG